MNKTREVLLKAAELLETKGWTQKEYARDAMGRPTGTLSPDAACYCLMGSIYAAGDQLEVDIYGEQVVEKVRAQLPYSTIPRFNDAAIPRFNDAVERTKEEVIAVLKAAAEECK